MFSTTFSSISFLLLFSRTANAQRSFELFDLLPEDPKLYDKMRPPKINDQATVVDFQIIVTRLDSIDENSMTYSADIILGQKWKDNRLRLPENVTSDSVDLEVDWLKKIWRPDCFFKNAMSVIFQTTTIPYHPQSLTMTNDKSIIYIAKLTLKLSCPMNFQNYPHDTQKCKLGFYSLLPTTDIIFRWVDKFPLLVNENITLPQLQLVKYDVADCSINDISCLGVVFVLKRRLGYYLVNTYIPTCLIVIMSWVPFWLKPEAASGRITLGIISLLILTVQHIKSQASLPPVSYLRVIDVFILVCTMFVFTALLEYCLVNIVLGDSDAAMIPPATPPPEPTPAQRARIRALNIDRFSRIFFPVLFAVLNCIYWLLVIVAL